MRFATPRTVFQSLEPVGMKRAENRNFEFLEMMFFEIEFLGFGALSLILRFFWKVMRRR